MQFLQRLINIKPQHRAVILAERLFLLLMISPAAAIGFDPNIQEGYYSGSAINLVMYGLVNSTVKAKIRGGSVSGSDPNIYSFSYSPDNPIPTPNNGDFNFSTQGEKFTKFSKLWTVWERTLTKPLNL